MFTLFVSLLFSVPACFRTRAALQAEILALRHQFLVLQRSNDGHRVRLRATDRLLWVWLSRLWTGWQSALVIVKPETVEFVNRHRLASERLPALLDLEESPSRRPSIRFQ
jgi:putative transposase